MSKVPGSVRINTAELAELVSRANVPADLITISLFPLAFDPVDMVIPPLVAFSANEPTAALLVFKVNVAPSTMTSASAAS